MRETDTLKKKMIRLVFPIAFQQFMLALVVVYRHYRKYGWLKNIT